MAVETNDETLARLLFMTESDKNRIAAERGWHHESEIYSSAGKANPTPLDVELAHRRAEDEALAKALEGVMRALNEDALHHGTHEGDCQACGGQGIITIPGAAFALRICDACEGTGQRKPEDSA